MTNPTYLTPLDRRQLGQSEFCVSPIGLGCVTFGREIDEATSQTILDHAMELGITLLDTAAVYGDGASEKILGRWMRDRATRGRIVLATKEGFLGLCATKRIGVISYSPLGAGFLTGKYRRDGGVPQGTRFDVKPAHRDIYFTEHGFGIVESLRAAAKKARRTMPELALAWVFRQPAITSVLVGARTPRHVDQAFEAVKMAQEPGLRSVLDDVANHVASPATRIHE